MRAVKDSLGHSFKKSYGEWITLVGRTQQEINQPPSLKRKTNEIGGIICNFVRRPHITTYNPEALES